MLAGGDRLGPYELLSHLGEGGMGEVWKARDPRLNRSVAIKVSKIAFSDRFEREARAIAALNHPHICTLHDVGPNYLVMELVEGTPLRGPLPAEKAVEYGSQILDALDAAHRKGFTHRDLKPANILVTKQGIKLLDFGLVKQSAPLAETESTLTETGQIVGTLRYMAPEQLQGKEADARSDLFSFGCVLYEMLSGKKAFDGPERDSTSLELRPPLGPVIKRCLAQDPDERFQTARDLKYNLRLAMQQQPATTAKPARWYWLAMAAAIVLAAFGAWALWRSQQNASEPQAVRLEISPPEGGQFDAASLAVSPDSRTLAFVATVHGKRRLWIRPLDASASRLLPGTDGAYYPFWSPDSRSIAYFAAYKLWRVDIAGGTPLAICDSGLSESGTWGTDGTIVFTALGRGLRRVHASGGSPAPLTMVARGEISHDGPQLLSDGRFLYWIRGSEQNAGTYTSTLDHPEQRIRLLATASPTVYAAGHLLWLRGSTLVAQQFDADRLKLSGEPRPVADPVGGSPIVSRTNSAAASGGLLLYSSLGVSNRLTWFDGTGKALGTLGEPGALGTLRLSPDGRRAAVNRASGGSTDLWMVEIGRNISSRLTFALGTNSFPVWSPDGRTVVFRSTGNLYRRDASGAGVEERVTESGNFPTATDWSRDGRFMLFYERAQKTQLDLWVLPVAPDGKPEAGAKPRLYLQTRFNELQGRFSPEPNPRWVAYTSDETGRDEVYIQAFPEPRGKIPISTGGGRFPIWAPSGREVYYMAFNSKLMAVSLKLEAGSVDASVPRELFTVPWDESTLSPYDVAPDGRFLVRATPDTDSQPLQVIINWPALLKKGAQ